jgi:hypothetical protein
MAAEMPEAAEPGMTNFSCAKMTLRYLLQHRKMSSREFSVFPGIDVLIATDPSTAPSSGPALVDLPYANHDTSSVLYGHDVGTGLGRGRMDAIKVCSVVSPLLNCMMPIFQCTLFFLFASKLFTGTNK